MDPNPILTILGPTASGKTGLAIELARRLGGEVIGLDSRQIFSGMAIGTAQPTKEDQSGIRHHLIGIRPPDQSISAGEYARFVFRKIDSIEKRGNVPIICGGAGLYYRAITRGIFPGSVSNLEIRRRLDREFDEKGGESLLQRLVEFDPEYAAIVHPNNRKRLVRALEIAEATGRPPSYHFQKQPQAAADYKYFSVLLVWPMKMLEARIRDRTASMLNSGWVDEVKRLEAKYPDTVLPPLDSIGYRQVLAYLRGGTSLSDLQDEIVLRTRQYSRRQLQWFKKEPIDLTISMETYPDLRRLAEHILEKFNPPGKPEKE